MSSFDVRAVGVPALSCGTTAANDSGIQMETVRNIALAWILTLPCAMVISGTLYVVFSKIFLPQRSPMLSWSFAKGATMDRECETLLRQYAAGDMTWRSLRSKGIDNYRDVLAGLGELGLRPPVAPMDGPNAEIRMRARAIIQGLLRDQPRR